MWIVLQIAGSKSFTQGRNAFLAPQPVCAGGALLCSTALIFIIICIIVSVGGVLLGSYVALYDNMIRGTHRGQACDGDVMAAEARDGQVQARCRCVLA